jgi:opacity protein-like surface antigen
MKKLLTALCLTCALTIAAQAEDATQTKKKHSAKAPTPEQKAAQKEILEKYDTNKDGKLDKVEIQDQHRRQSQNGKSRHGP